MSCCGQKRKELSRVRAPAPGKAAIQAFLARRALTHPAGPQPDPARQPDPKQTNGLNGTARTASASARAGGVPAARPR